MVNLHQGVHFVQRIKDGSGLDMMPFSLAKKWMGVTDVTERKRIGERLHRLGDYLHQRDPVAFAEGIRDDSRLCWEWAAQQEGDTTFTQESVADALLKMTFLFRNTDYGTASSALVRKLSRSLQLDYNLDKTTSIVLATRYGIPCLKLLYVPTTVHPAT